MLKRRRLHKMYDSIICEARVYILERNSHAGDKNLILKECYVTLEQLSGLQNL